MQEFQFLLHPKIVDRMLDNATHHLRRAIQFKWSVAEREVRQLRVILGGKKESDSSYLERDVKTLKKNNILDIQSHRNTILKLHEPYLNPEADRQTLTHGSLMTSKNGIPPMHVVNGEPTSSHWSQIYRPSTMVMTRHGKNIP